MAVPAHATLLRFSPSQLLRAAQSGDPNARAAQDCIVDVFGEQLTKITTRTCRRYYLPHQEREDVLAETYQQILNPEIVRFRTGCDKPEHYFIGIVQNAARKIKAQIRPGYRRKGGQVNGSNRNAQHHSGTDDRPLARGAWPASATDAADVRDKVEFILKQAPPRLRKALQLCYWEDWTIQGIAAHLGVSRFALKREILAFFKKMSLRLGNGSPRPGSLGNAARRGKPEAIRHFGQLASHGTPAAL